MAEGIAPWAAGVSAGLNSETISKRIPRVLGTALGIRTRMFKHRRFRVVCVLLVAWALLAVVEWWHGGTPWPAAALSALLWACVVAATWWFVEVAQGRSARVDSGRSEQHLAGRVPPEPGSAQAPGPTEGGHDPVEAQGH